MPTYFESISLERVSCRFGSLALRCCPLMCLQSEREKCVCHKSNFHCNIFTNGGKLKTHENLVLYIAGNFCRCKISWKCVQRNFLGIYFHKTNASCSDHTSTFDGHVPHVNQRNNIERQSEEESMCTNALIFLLCGGLRNNYGFYLRGSKSVCENSENLHPAKFPAIRYVFQSFKLLTHSPLLYKGLHLDHGLHS